MKDYRMLISRDSISSSDSPLRLLSGANCATLSTLMEFPNTSPVEFRMMFYCFMTRNRWVYAEIVFNEACEVIAVMDLPVVSKDCREMFIDFGQLDA